MARKTLSRQDLEDISARTLEHYNRRAEDFWKGTRDHDVSQNIAALLSHIEGEPPFAILDLGCGPGRDLKAFAGLGHVAVEFLDAGHLEKIAPPRPQVLHALEIEEAIDDAGIASPCGLLVKSTSPRSVSRSSCRRSFLCIRTIEPRA